MSGSNKIYVLYKISNGKCDSGHYNAFPMSRSASGITLAEVKRQCLALKAYSNAGPDGFHWRVRVDDNKQQKSGHYFTWWDVIDENSKLPIKENVPLSELEQMFAHSHHHNHAAAATTSTTRVSSGVGSGMVAGAVRKAFQNVASTVEDVVNSSSSVDVDLNEPRVSVIAFKLLDLIKLQNEYNKPVSSTPNVKNTGSTSFSAPFHRTPSNAAPLPTAQQQRRPTDVRVSTTTTTTTNVSAVRKPQPSLSQSMPPSAGKPRVATSPAPRAASAMQKPAAPSRSVVPPVRSAATAARTEELLMDFGATTTNTSVHHRSFSATTTTSNNTASKSFTTSETKEEKLKREYAEKAQQQNRVWDEVDKRWVVVDTTSDKEKVGVSVHSSTTSTHVSTVKIKGISLDDTSNAVGKSARVQSAVHQRVTEMKMAQEKAKDELKQRQEMAASLEQEEDVVRIKLDPKIKHWSEEHGQKKQLAALLSSLHLVIWPEAQWKQVNLGDLLEEKKLRSCYKRASLKVHPDKTKDLSAEQRFLAKRIFDALTQAMTVYEDAKRS